MQFPLDSSVCRVETTCPLVQVVESIFPLVSCRQYFGHDWPLFLKIVLWENILVVLYWSGKKVFQGQNLVKLLCNPFPHFPRVVNKKLIFRRRTWFSSERSNLKHWRLRVWLPVVVAVRYENKIHLLFHAPRCSHESPAAHRQSFLLFLLSTSVCVRHVCLRGTNHVIRFGWK